MTGSDDWILLALWLQLLLITLTYSAVAIPHTLPSTAAHPLRFSVSTSHLLAIAFNLLTYRAEPFHVISTRQRAITPVTGLLLFDITCTSAVWHYLMRGIT
jgi:hypothetical protein